MIEVGKLRFEHEGSGIFSVWESDRDCWMFSMRIQVPMKLFKDTEALRNKLFNRYWEVLRPDRLAGHLPAN